MLQHQTAASSDGHRFLPPTTRATPPLSRIVHHDLDGIHNTAATHPPLSHRSIYLCASFPHVTRKPPAMFLDVSHPSITDQYTPPLTTPPTCPRPLQALPHTFPCMPTYVGSDSRRLFVRPHIPSDPTTCMLQYLSCTSPHQVI